MLGILLLLLIAILLPLFHPVVISLGGRTLYAGAWNYSQGEADLLCPRQGWNHISETIQVGQPDKPTPYSQTGFGVRCRNSVYLVTLDTPAKPSST